jgi:hypothetical protein
MKVLQPFKVACLVFAAMFPAAVQAQFTFTTNTDNTLTITSYTGSGGNVTIPDTTNGLPVKVVGDDAFAYCSNLDSVTISTNVTSIGVEAFRSCENLASVTIPNSVTNIGGGTFAWCISLTNITIPGNVTFIDIAAFYECTSLNGVYFQGNAPSVGSDPFGGSGLDPFFGDNSATAFFLPGTTGWESYFADLPTWSSYYITNNGTITIIGYAGFGGAVTIPTTIYGLPVTSIGTNAFAYNSSVTSVTIPNSVTNIGDAAFYLCTNLTTFYFQDDAPSVGTLTFYGITNATVYYLPGAMGWGSSFDGFTAWALYPFIYTTNNDTLTIIGYTGGGGAISIPGTIFGLPVTSIERNAFEDCYSLTSVTIGNSVTNIGIDAFAYCYSLTNVIIPSSVTNLGSVAFQWCSNLKTAYFQGNAPNVPYSDAFAEDTNLVVYYLPGALGWGVTYEGHPVQLWIPQVQMGGGDFGMQTNQFGFNINWACGQTVVVEACTNLFNPDWHPVMTNTLTGGTAYFSDSEWTNYPARFYRLRWP